jgi:small-conductance mechanosensitive channel
MSAEMAELRNPRDSALALKQQASLEALSQKLLDAEAAAKARQTELADSISRSLEGQQKLEQLAKMMQQLDALASSVRQTDEQVRKLETQDHAAANFALVRGELDEDRTRIVDEEMRTREVLANLIRDSNTGAEKAHLALKQELVRELDKMMEELVGLIRDAVVDGGGGCGTEGCLGWRDYCGKLHYCCTQLLRSLIQEACDHADCDLLLAGLIQASPMLSSLLAISGRPFLRRCEIVLGK